MQASIARGLAYAPYADMLWMETSTPSLEEAKEFADAIHAKYPGIVLPPLNTYEWLITRP